MFALEFWLFGAHRCCIFSDSSAGGEIYFFVRIVALSVDRSHRVDRLETHLIGRLCPSKLPYIWMLVERWLDALHLIEPILGRVSCPSPAASWWKYFHTLSCRESARQATHHEVARVNTLSPLRHEPFHICFIWIGRWLRPLHFQSDEPIISLRVCNTMLLFHLFPDLVWPRIKTFLLRSRKVLILLKLFFDRGGHWFIIRIYPCNLFLTAPSKHVLNNFTIENY